MSPATGVVADGGSAGWQGMEHDAAQQDAPAHPAAGGAAPGARPTANGDHQLAWFKLPADAAKLLPELQQLYCTYQVEHAMMLERLHAHQQQLAAAEAPAASTAAANADASAPSAPAVGAADQPDVKAAAAAPDAPPEAVEPGVGDTEMAEAGAEAAPVAGDVTWPSVRELIASRLRTEAVPVVAAAPPALAAAPALPALKAKQGAPSADWAARAGGDQDGTSAPTRAPHGDERVGRGSDAPPSLLSDVERLLGTLEPGQVPVVSAEQLQEWQQAWAGVEERVAAQERVACAVSTQWMDAQGAVACLCGDLGRYVLRRTTISIGRVCESHPGEVDLDLSAYPGAAKISRLQAALRLDIDGVFRVTNMGRRELYVNGVRVTQGDTAVLPHLGLLEMASCKLLFLVNFAAVRRATARSQQLRV